MFHDKIVIILRLYTSVYTLQCSKIDNKLPIYPRWLIFKLAFPHNFICDIQISCCINYARVYRV